MQFVLRIANNFFLRNVAVILLFLSPDILQAIAKPGAFDAARLTNTVFSFTAFFMYFAFHNRILYEQFLSKKKYVAYVLLFLPTLFLWRESTSYLFWLMTKPGNETVYTIRELKEYNGWFWAMIYWADIVYIYISLGVYLAFRFFNERARLLQIENIQKELELKQLNEQLNPHFLFNALNNIYSHLLRQSDDGKELILKLSELMRHILDSSSKDTVSLKDELAFIDNYIAFERERLGDRCNVTYSKDIKAIDFQIVPLIAFNFIENAFKHGTTSINRTDINIGLSVNDEMMRLTIANPIFDNDLASTKTGISNTKRRLELLYPGRHKLDIMQQEGRHEVSLEINNQS